MKTYLTSTAALVLVLGLQTQAFAYKDHGKGGNQQSHGNSGQVNNNQIHFNQTNNTQNIINNKNVPNVGNKVVDHKGNKSPGKYDYSKTFKDYKGPCYKGKGCNFWTRCYWDTRYGCNLYWCQPENCWFYWCQPHGCYLPVEYCPCGVYVFAN